jgi:hypothetical protein
LEKSWAVSAAYNLIEVFGSETPTLTTDGRYLRLSEILLEMVTNKSPDGQGRGLEYACRKTLAEKRAAGEHQVYTVT